jgi:hypothetical protein
MLKLYGLIQRRADLTLADFSRHWRTVHRELALRLVAPGIMRGYVQNHRSSFDIPGVPCPADGCPEVWLDRLEDLERLATSPEYLEGAALDEPNFITGGSVPCLGQPRHATGVDRAALSGCRKVMLFYARDAAIDDVALSFERPWSTSDSQPLRLERDLCLTAVPGAAPYVAVESTWWTDTAEFLAAWSQRRRLAQSPALAAAMPIDELVVLWPSSA